VITLCYLFFSAIPKYNTPVWETAVEFPDDAAVPAIAWLTLDGGPDNPQGNVQYVPSGTDGNHTVAAYTAQGLRQFNDSSPDTYYTAHVEGALGIFPPMTAAVANMSSENFSVGSALQTTLSSAILLACKSPLLSHPNTHPQLNPPDNSTLQHPGLASVSPFLSLAVFDPRLTVREMIQCSIVQVSVPAAFTVSSYVMKVSRLSDRRRKMRPPTLTPDSVCDRVYNDLLPNADPPLSIFDLSLTSSTTTVSDFAEECDVRLDADAGCITSAQLIYGTQFVSVQRSVPGKSMQDIWIDCGAIVGAVQFFAWFLYVYFQP
jgi:hypothetical protein